MEATKKLDTDTGKNDGQTPILANDDHDTADQSKPAPTESELRSIIAIANQLAFLQNDCSELQSAGVKAAILAKDKKLIIVLDYPSHELGFDTGKGHILLDGVPVLKVVQSDTGKAILAKEQKT